ncbi:MAG: TetR/AcrR family transcriptional regulator [Pseudomonadota bacterium]
MARRQNDTSLTRSAIQKTAERMITEGGVRALSVSRLAQSLDMTHGNVYRHFPSKAALTAEVAAGWMQEMREACETAVACGGATDDRLLALVLAIREQMALRASVPDALSVFHFVLEHKPKEALAHHQHRLGLVVRIMMDAGWPDTEDTNVKALAVLDAMRTFTDPNVFSTAAETADRIKEVVGVLTHYIDHGP